MQNGTLGIDEETIGFCAATVETQEIGGLVSACFFSVIFPP